MLLLRFVRLIRTGDLILCEKLWDEIAVGRSFSITTTTLAGSLCTCATWWTCEWNTHIPIDSLLMDVSPMPKRKTLSQWLDLRDSWPTLKRVDVIWDRYLPDSSKQRPDRGGEQESDNGWDIMGMGNFREIGTAICKTQVTRCNCSIICQLPLLRPSSVKGRF